MSDASEDREMVKALERVVRIKDWNHDEDSSARFEYDNAAEQCRSALTALREASYTVTRSGHGIIRRQKPFVGTINPDDGLTIADIPRDNPKMEWKP